MKQELTIETFRKQLSWEKRLEIVQKKKLDNPTKVPICIFRAQLRDSLLLPYINPQLLVDGDLNFNWTMKLIRDKKMKKYSEKQENTQIQKAMEEEKKALTLDPSETLFYFIYQYKKDEMKPFVEGHIPSGSDCMDVIYNQFKSDDGFLYIIYAKESTMGLHSIKNV